MVHLSTDVLITGAGPVGLATAIGLAQLGVNCLIIDALPEARNTSRAAVIHAATLDSLASLGMADRLVAQGLHVPHFRVRDRDSVLMHIDFSGLPSATPYALMIPQDETEILLAQRLGELGHTVHRSARLTGFEREGPGVRAMVDSAEGFFTIHARFLVGADGQDSAVRNAAGIDFRGETYGSFILADVHMQWPLAMDEVTVFFSESGMLVVAPMSEGRHRIVAQLANAPSAPNVQDVQRVIDTRGPLAGAQIDDLLWSSRFRINHKIADCFYDGPVLLVGDAAHVHSPAGGQGMNLGLRDAQALSVVLAHALRHSEHDRLAAWADERRRKAGSILSMTERLTRIATLKNPASRCLRNRLIADLGKLSIVRRSIARRLAGYA